MDAERVIFVLDSCAMIAYLRKEIGADVNQKVIVDAESVCYAHAINLCEVYYDFWRVGGKSPAERQSRTCCFWELSSETILTRIFGRKSVKSKQTIKHRSPIAVPSF